MANRHETVLPFLILMFIIHLSQSDTLTCTSSVTTISLNPSTDPYKTYKYPASGLYPRTTTCKWLFQPTDASSRITFEVTSVYVDCGDTLKFYDGTSSSASAIGGSVCCSSSSSCGSSKPPETTTGSNLFLQLDSDGTSNSYESGFTVTVVVGKDESNCTTSGTFNINLDSSLTLTSPDFPANYPISRTCTYTYTYSSGNVQIEFIYMKVELDSGRCFDFVEIYNGSSTSSPVIAQVCGDTVPTLNTYTSSGTSLTIKFSSDVQVTKKGFLARVTPIDQNAISSTGTTGSSSMGNSSPFVADSTGTNGGVIAAGVIVALVAVALFVAGGVILYKKKQTRSVDIENEQNNEDKKEKIPDVTNQTNIQLSPPPAGTKCVT